MSDFHKRRNELYAEFPDESRAYESEYRAVVGQLEDVSSLLAACQARLAEAERAIESAGRCLVLSNNGAREALAILRGYKERATDSASGRETA